MITIKKDIKGLRAEEYEHPLDRKALENLKNTPGLETLVRKFNKYSMDKILKVSHTGSNVRITEKMFPELYKLFQESCQRLDMDYHPDLYIIQEPKINAFAAGVEEPIVVITSGAYDLLDRDELIFILGHELGHVKSEHVLYHQMASYLPYIGNLIGSATLGLGSLISTSLELALLNWKRKSEFTSDRAGLLCCQNFTTVITAMMKMGGAPPEVYDRLDHNAFLQQAREFEGFDEDNFDKFAKIFSVMFASHPWTVMRAAEIENWYNYGRYDDILVRKIESGGTLFEEPLYLEGDNDQLNFCTKCGSRINKNMKFCTKCGSEIVRGGE
ncbi:MAG: M48 family metallopeptidase [Bacillota bacterium]